MTYLRFDLTLRSPAIVSTLLGDPNSAATQSFIPGSAIRGVLAARLLAAGEDGAGELFRRLILSGDVRYLNAYPTITGARSLPVPLSWRCPKGETESAVDLASFIGCVTDSDDPEDFAELWPHEALTSVSGAFTAPSVDGGHRVLGDVMLGARIHQQRDRVKGRSWTDENEQRHGTIFAYEYLEEGQTFSGAIQVTEAASGELERIKGLLTESILVGRSRRSGYGGEATVLWRAGAEREFAGAAQLLDANVPEGGRFRVLLTSAYIGRHPLTGQVNPVALDHELGATLGGAAHVEARRWGFETVGGFNRKWALETPQAMAVRGGSVLVLRATQPIDLARLTAIENAGLGERRGEGFGRLAFLEHPDANETIQLKVGEDAQPQVAAPAADLRDPQLAFLEARLVLSAARTELDRVARLDIVKTATDLPTNSLLGRLRAPLRGALDEQAALAALQTLATWCGKGTNALKDGARDKLEKCRLSDKRNLLAWLAAIASVPNEQSGWATLLVATNNQASVSGCASRHHLTTTGAAQKVLDESAAALRIHLIDAVLAAMAQKNRRGGA